MWFEWIGFMLVKIDLLAALAHARLAGRGDNGRRIEQCDESLKLLWSQVRIVVLCPDLSGFSFVFFSIFPLPPLPDP